MRCAPAGICGLLGDRFGPPARVAGRRPWPSWTASRRPPAPPRSWSSGGGKVIAPFVRVPCARTQPAAQKAMWKLTRGPVSAQPRPPLPGDRVTRRRRQVLPGHPGAGTWPPQGPVSTVRRRPLVSGHPADAVRCAPARSRKRPATSWRRPKSWWGGPTPRGRAARPSHRCGAGRQPPPLRQAPHMLPPAAQAYERIRRRAEPAQPSTARSGEDGAHRLEQCARSDAQQRCFPAGSLAPAALLPRLAAAHLGASPLARQFRLGSVLVVRAALALPALALTALTVALPLRPSGRTRPTRAASSWPARLVARPGASCRRHG